MQQKPISTIMLLRKKTKTALTVRFISKSNGFFLFDVISYLLFPKLMGLFPVISPHRWVISYQQSLFELICNLFHSFWNFCRRISPSRGMHFIVHCSKVSLNKVYVVISYPKDTASIGDRRAGFINLAWSDDEKANKEGLRTKGSR